MLGHSHGVGLKPVVQLVDPLVSRILELLQTSVGPLLPTEGTMDGGTATTEQGSLTRLVDGPLEPNGDGFLQPASTLGLQVVV